MSRLFLVLSLLLLLSNGLSSQTPNVTIRGNVEDGAGKEVLLIGYTDQLTYHEYVIDRTVIDEDGNFSLQTYVNYPTLVVVQIEHYSQSFYVEAGRVYDAKIRDFDWNVNEWRNIYLDPVTLPLEFSNLPARELNVSVSTFDRVVDSFMYVNREYFDFRFHVNKQYFDTLVMEVNNRCPSIGNDYFDRYKQYHLAALKCQLRFESRNSLFKKYIDNQPILYYDDSYMKFFFTLFEKQLSRGNRYVRVDQMAQWVDKVQLDRMMDSLGVDPLLRNEQVRELAVLQFLKEAYHYEYYYHPSKVRLMVEQLAQRTKFPQHQEMAQHLLAHFDKVETTSKVSTFCLPDVDKHKVCLDSLKGRWIYLSFVRTADPASLSEIETMAHFHDSVCDSGSNVSFVTVCCDREFQKMYHFLRNGRHSNRYNWLWVHFDGQYQVLEDFKVVSYPTFLLINPEGRLHYSVTPSPASGIFLHGPWEKKKTEEERKFFLDRY
ncbi:MAG: redoxin domain-containing protein [Bacteroidales bacterium]|nr:redoxin domain-containing protein [Candidatus Colimorpha onthohippi]